MAPSNWLCWTVYEKLTNASVNFNIVLDLLGKKSYSVLAKVAYFMCQFFASVTMLYYSHFTLDPLTCFHCQIH